MPTKASIDAFVRDVLSNDHVGAAERWYAEDAGLRENLGPVRVGRAGLVERERAIMARSKSIKTELVSGPLIDGETVAIRWRFTFEWKDGGGISMEEVAWQQWSNGKIVLETFFYDPSQRAGSGNHSDGRLGEH